MILHKTPIISQHLHIKKESWRRRSCGIASLSMIMSHHGKKISPDEILEKGLELNAYLENIGWKHRGLADIANFYGLQAKNLDLINEKDSIAFQKFIQYLKKAPVLVSVYLDFNTKNGGHLIAATGFSKDTIFYNEPNSKTRNEIKKSIPLNKFLAGWKKRFIIVHKQ